MSDIGGVFLSLVGLIVLSAIWVVTYVKEAEDNIIQAIRGASEKVGNE